VLDAEGIFHSGATMDVNNSSFFISRIFLEAQYWVGDRVGFENMVIRRDEISTTNLNLFLRPNRNNNAGNRQLYVAGSVLSDEDNKLEYSLGGNYTGGFKARFHTGWFGDGGLWVSPLGKYGFGLVSNDSNYLSLRAQGIYDFNGGGQLGLPSGNTDSRKTGVSGDIRYNTDTAFAELYSGSSWFTIASRNWVRDYVAGNLPTELPGDSWGTQAVVTADQDGLLGVGTVEDSLRINWAKVAAKAYVDSLVQAAINAGGDGLGVDGVLHDNTLVNTGKPGSLLGVSPDVVALRSWVVSALDSTKQTIPGTDKFPSITGVSTTPTLGNAADKFATEQQIFNAIQQAVVSAGTTLTGWYNFLDFPGVVADATFTTGTDCYSAWTSFVNTAPEGSVLYIPRGKYYSSQPLVFPSNKRLYVWQEGDLYFRTGNGYIIDGVLQRLWVHGKINGTNQDITTPTYNTQTNIGIWLRNGGYNQVEVNEIHGFKYAIQIGGFATGSDPVQGQQYATVRFSFLRRNSVGVYFHPEGGTTDSRGNWSNQNYVEGGRIAGDTGVVFYPDVTQDDQFNGNVLYNVGFEGAYTGANMKVGVYGKKGRNNTLIGWRYEKVDDPLHFENDWDNFQMYGSVVAVDWLQNPGNNITIYGELYEPINGITLGTRAQGYIYSSTNTFYNGRVRIWGTKRSPNAASVLPSNIDMVWEVETDITTTAATYTVEAGIDLVMYNYSGGTGVLTLPTASQHPNRVIHVRNMHLTNTVTVSGAGANQITSIPANTSITYYCTGVQWVSLNNPGGTTSGGSSPLIADGSNYRLPQKLALGRSGPTAKLHIAGGDGTVNNGSLKIDAGALVSSPEAGLFEHGLDGSLYFTDANNVRHKFAFDFGVNYLPYTLNTNTAYTPTPEIGVIYVTYSGSGSANIVLPTPSNNAGRELTIRNRGTASGGVVVTNGDNGALNTLNGQSAAVYFCDGTSWVLKSRWVNAAL
jgi:hypothetical protein